MNKWTNFRNRSSLPINGENESCELEPQQQSNKTKTPTGMSTLTTIAIKQSKITASWTNASKLVMPRNVSR